MTRTLTSALFFSWLALVLCTPSAYAEDFWLDKVGVTPAQHKKIKAIALKTKRQMILAKAQIKLATMDLMTIIDEDRPDQKKAMKALEKVGTMELQMKKLYIMQMIKIKALLNPKQLKKLRKASKEKQKRKRMMRQQFKRWMKSQK